MAEEIQKIQQELESASQMILVNLSLLLRAKNWIKFQL